MKILTSNQIREADQSTIENEPIASIDLMERAARLCSDWFIHKYKKDTFFTVLCGTGNNGGDGFAIARHLIDQGFDVMTYWIKASETISNDCQKNVQRLMQMGTNIETVGNENYAQMTYKGIVIDAIFGTGLSRPVEGFCAEIIKQVNQSNLEVISIDVPSGMMSEDNTSNNEKHIICADYTLTFQQPKLAFLLPDVGENVGEFVLLDIGLDQDFISKCESPYHFSQQNDIASTLKKRDKFSHKGTYGHALICAGSYGKMGAAILSTSACLRSGVGLITTYIPTCGYEIMQTELPEAMVLTDTSTEQLSSFSQNTIPYQSIAVGPGIGTHADTVLFLDELISSYTKPMVVDADAINILAAHKELMQKVPKNSVFTPHVKEFHRLVGKEFQSSYERLQKAREWCVSNEHILVLKGAYTAVISVYGVVHFNSTGNPGMATGGSGDVLTGIICSLLAQGYEPLNATRVGVFVHGKAGEIAAKEIGSSGMIASDIVRFVPKALEDVG